MNRLLHFGVAPQLGGATLALGQAAKARRANSALYSRANAMKRMIEAMINEVNGETK